LWRWGSSNNRPLKESAHGKKMEDEYKNFLAELGGGGHQYHGFYAPPPPKNAPLAPPLSVSSGPAAPPSWGRSNVGAPPPVPSGHSNAVESEYERFMSEMGR